MGRSSWKGPFVNSDSNNSLIKTKARNTSIVSDFVGKMFQVYNGKSYVKILVHEEMIGHKLGEFSSTRKIFSFKKKLNK